jgi:hypothetical protein
VHAAHLVSGSGEAEKVERLAVVDFRVDLLERRVDGVHGLLKGLEEQLKDEVVFKLHLCRWYGRHGKG